MQSSKKQLTQNLALFLFASLFSANPVMAESDQQMFLKAREIQEQLKGHAGHAPQVDKKLEFRGVFYGYVPCDDCAGIKMTLSLKQNNNYLLVTQPARDSSKEYYEKGKYSWDEEKKLVILTPRKEGVIQKYLIKNEETLVRLNSDGTQMSDGEHILRRSDSIKARQVHIH